MSTDERSLVAGEPVWATEPLRLPPLERDRETGVCVVGMGGSGLAALEELQRLGVSAIGIDAAEVGGGAAGRNGGFLLGGTYLFYHGAVAAYGRTRAREIYAHTLREIERMRRDTPEVVRVTGSLRIADSAEEREDCERQESAMRLDDLPVQPYRGPEGEGLLFERDGVFEPLRRCQLTARRLLATRGQIFEGTRALHVERGRVHTPSAVIRCEAVIVAVDGRLEALLPELGGRVRTARLQMLATRPLDHLRFPRPVYARWGYEYWQQLPNRRVALGGFRDLGGEAEWTHSTEPSDPVQEALEAHLRTRLGIAAPITHRWAASASFTRSGLPILEEVRSGVWAAGGYSGTGNVIGRLCGRAAARLATGSPTELHVLGEDGSEPHLEGI